MKKSPLLPLFFILLIVALDSSTVHASCATDRSGVVYCSKFPAGGAVLGPDGSVICGKGECHRNKFGRFECSTVAGGGAGRDHRSVVRCLGGCEDAAEKFCEAGK